MENLNVLITNTTKFSPEFYFDKSDNARTKTFKATGIFTTISTIITLGVNIN